MNHDAETPVAPDTLDWADVIFVMEKTHCNRLSRRFRTHLRNKRVICLEIPDIFDYMEPALVELLRARVTPHLSRT